MSMDDLSTIVQSTYPHVEGSVVSKMVLFNTKVQYVKFWQEEISKSEI